MESLAISLKAKLNKRGLHVPVRGVWPREISVDSLKFFLKQQQKVLEDCQGSKINGQYECVSGEGIPLIILYVVVM